MTTEKELFQKSFEGPYHEPSLAELARRFERAFARTGDTHSSMAAVNEVIEAPIEYETFMAWIREAAA